MKKLDFVKKLFQETKTWEEKGILGQSTIKKLESHYKQELKNENNDLPFVKVFSIIAIISIILGSSIFFFTSGEAMTIFQKVLSIGAFFLLVISSTFLLIKRKILLNSFVLLRVVSIGVGILMLSLNAFLSISVPLFVILLLRALCLAPFVWVYRFKYFLIFYMLLFNAAITAFAYKYFPHYYHLISIWGFIVVGIVVQNVAKTYKGTKAYEEHKSYYNLRYVLGNTQGILALLLLTTTGFVGQIVSPETQAYIAQQGKLWFFVFVGSLPLISSLVLIVLGTCKFKKTTQHCSIKGLLSKIKKDLIRLINDLFILFVGLSFFTGFSWFGLDGSIWQRGFTIWYLCLVGFLIYEGVHNKHRGIVSIALLGIISFILLKYVAFAYSVLSLGLFLIGGGILLIGSVLCTYSIAKNKICPLVKRKT